MNRFRCRSSPFLNDEADLSVDVMRFFAIVAICLFALAPMIDGGGKGQAQHGLELRQPQVVEKKAYTDSLVSDVENVVPRSVAFKLNNYDRAQQRIRPAPTDNASQKDEQLEEKGIRFISQRAFDSAIASKRISLWVKTNDARFVFDVDRNKFRLGDEVALLYPIGDAEINEQLKSLAAVASRQPAKEWYITLPTDTVRQAAAALQAADKWVLLSAQASIIAQ